MQNAFRAAVDNVAHHGDTDVFPFPLENHVFFDRPAAVVAVLDQVHSNFDTWIDLYPPLIEGLLSPAGYTGFRWTSQIDPMWNAYLLGLVLSLAEEIEAARLPTSLSTVFSYRFQWDPEAKTVFDKSVGWAEFQRESVERARNAAFVLACDIADFYPRVYHHRLENALQRAVANQDAVRRIMALLQHLANNVSYGLPIGGPAARLLSELVLNSTDRLLLTNRTVFTRFADDYHIFVASEEEAYRQLVFLSERLISNEGLLLQKTKTRIMSSDEFLATSEFAAENEPEGAEEKMGREFLRLRLHYDPYSRTANEEYEALRAEISRFDILGMIGREMRKSRVQQNLTRKLLGSLRLLEPMQRDAAVLSLMENLHVLYPVFSSVMMLIKSIVDELDAAAQQQVFAQLRTLISDGSYIVQVPAHLGFAVRVLAHDESMEADEVLARIYRDTHNPVIRRDVILAMARRNAHYWVSDIRRNFGTVSGWERTALVAASYTLGDEGKHWRGAIKGELTPMQTEVRNWAADRANRGDRKVPL